MPIQINVTIPPASLAYLGKLAQLPGEVPRAIKRGLDRGLVLVKQQIIDRRLTGSGPFPPSRHKLGERSGTLKSGVYTHTAVIRGSNVVGEIGARAIDPRTGQDYAGVHEYGATISAKNAPFLVFKIKGRTIRTKSVVIPERAPFRTELGLVRTERTITDEIVDEIEKAASP